MRPPLLAWLLAALLFISRAQCVTYSVYYQLGAEGQVGARIARHRWGGIAVVPTIPLSADSERRDRKPAARLPK
jgi:hypothetical protein